MNKITHVNAKTIAEAVSNLSDKAVVVAGGTDIYPALKGMIYPKPPEKLVNIKTIPGMDYIKEEGGVLKIGALAKLVDVYESSVVQGKWPSLAEAAHRVASPTLRNMGTIGGNICQQVRCWYFRADHDAFLCFRKGGDTCFGTAGDNRYLSILAGQLCFATCPSDTAIALSALDATVVTTQRSLTTKDFFVVLGTVLKNNELVTEIQVPTPKAGTKQLFIKLGRRKSIDFAIASVAVAITTAGGTVSDARVVLGGVAPIPYRATSAEDFLKGKAINAESAGGAADEALKRAVPMSNNRYKIPIAKAMVKRAVLAVA